MSDPYDTLTVREISRLTKLPENTLYDLIRDGEIPAIRYGRRIRVRRQVLDHWIETQEGSSPRLATSGQVLSINALRTRGGSPRSS